MAANVRNGWKPDTNVDNVDAGVLFCVTGGLMRSFGFLIALVTLSSCSGAAERSIAERQVIKFHQAFNEQRYASVYEAAAPGFKKERSRDEFIALMESVHRRFGPVQSAGLRDWRTYWASRVGEFTTVTSDTTFSNGTATETFTFFQSRKPKLVMYNIS